jgi:hypothetical protein
MSAMTEPEKICFVIAPIGEEGSEIRKRSDRVFTYVIEPAALTCGYKAVRADKISTPGIITNQVIQEVINAPMAVADLTGHNANAFYELAVRHMVKKPLVQMITKGEKIPRSRPSSGRAPTLSITSERPKVGAATLTTRSLSRWSAMPCGPAAIPSRRKSPSLRMRSPPSQRPSERTSQT